MAFGGMSMLSGFKSAFKSLKALGTSRPVGGLKKPASLVMKAKAVGPKAIATNKESLLQSKSTKGNKGYPLNLKLTSFKPGIAAAQKINEDVDKSFDKSQEKLSGLLATAGYTGNPIQTIESMFQSGNTAQAGVYLTKLVSIVTAAVQADVAGAYAKNSENKRRLKNVEDTVSELQADADTPKWFEIDAKTVLNDNEVALVVMGDNLALISPGGTAPAGSLVYRGFDEDEES